MGPEVRDRSALIQKHEEVGDRVDSGDEHEASDGPYLPHDGGEAEVEATDAESEEHGGGNVAQLSDNGRLLGSVTGHVVE